MKIAEFVREKDIDIIHAHVPRDYIPASIASHTAKPSKFVLTRHMLSPLKPFNKFALKNLAKAIGVSDFVGGELRLVFPAHKVVVIRNGLDLENLRDREEMSNEFRRFHDIASGAPIVGTLGDLREAKGQRDFILAAAEVVKRIPDCWFVVTGLDHTMDKSFRRELRRLANVLGIGERVLWLDWLDDTAPFYAAIDVFVSPSHSESFGLAILEAMIRGTPVVATATEGARELLGADEKLVPIQDPVRLAAAICNILTTDDHTAIGDSMQRRAAEKFSLTRMLDETERVYAEIVNRKS